MKSINQIFKDNTSLMDEPEVKELIEYCQELEGKVMNKEDWTKEDWNHHMARLVMMAAEERGEMISYEDALKQVK